MSSQRRLLENRARKSVVLSTAVTTLVILAVVFSAGETSKSPRNLQTSSGLSNVATPSYNLLPDESFGQHSGESISSPQHPPNQDQRDLQLFKIRKLPLLDTPTGLTRFYAMADIPYTSSQLVYLQDQLNKLPADAEFFVHLGDIKSGANTNCVLQDYTSVADVLKTSRVPVFIVPGDNEWNDCADPNAAWQLWSSTFMFFNENWPRDFKVARMSKRNETFAFINKGTLFMGFNIPGGRIYNATEWNIRLSTQSKWAIKMIKYYDNVTDVGRVVMFSHADPTPDHAPFYDPLKQFVINELQNRIPILVLNGDGHVWQYQPTFFSPATSMLRIMLTANGSRPPHQCTINATGTNATFAQAFQCIF